MVTKTEVPDTLPTDDELLGFQQFLFEDELLALAEELATIRTQQSALAEDKKNCKLAIIREMKKLKKEKGSADLEDGERLGFWIEDTLKTKKIVSK